MDIVLHIPTWLVIGCKALVVVFAVIGILLLIRTIAEMRTFDRWIRDRFGW